MESGINADVLVCRTEHELSEDLRKKLALFCNVEREAVIQSLDAETIYDVPVMMLEEGLDQVVLKRLGMESTGKPDLTQWKGFLQRHKNPKSKVTIGLIGKYVELQDSYKSILEAFIHAGAANEVQVEVVPIHSETIEEGNAVDQISGLDGVLVAPGFGERGIEGKINAIRYVRENNIPFFGICLGMQMAVIEFARNVLNLKAANSVEMDENTPHPVISLMDAQKDVVQKGGTMRLGAWACDLKETTVLQKTYQTDQIQERHRHRYEFNDAYLQKFEENGMVASGTNPDTGLVEAIELPGHPWFVGVQFHPEYSSTVANPHPLFVAFVQAINVYAQSKN